MPAFNLSLIGRYGITRSNHPRSTSLARIFQCLAVPRKPLKGTALTRIEGNSLTAAEAGTAIVYCSISGYGQNGPSRDESAMDLIVQASSGLMSVTGTADGTRVRCGYSVADVSTGMFALIGILMALRRRDASGLGQFVDVSMLDSMISAMTSNFMIYLGSGSVPDPLGTSYSSIVPYRAFPTQDI